MLAKIKQDLNLALRAGDTLRLSVLRMVVSAVGYKQIEVQRELGDEDVLDVLKREAKKRREAIDSYTAAGRAEQAATEAAELAILNEYLPKQLGEDQVRQKVKEFKQQLGTVDYVGLIKVTMKELKGLADGAIIAKVVREETNG
jgi:uncharacterized protein YqeY